MSATCSYLGDGVRVTALPLLAAALSSSPAVVAAISACSTLPWLVFGLPVGVLVDRVSRAKLMITLQATRGLIGTLTVVAVATGRMTEVMLATVAALLGSCEVIYDLASHALLQALVPQDRLQWANGRLMGAEVATSEFAGPALGGVLFAVTAALPFGIDAATFFASAALLATSTSVGTSGAVPAAATTERILRQLLTGLRWFARAALVRTLTLLNTFINLGAGGFYAVFVLFTRHELALGPAGYGLLIAMSAVGSLAAAGVGDLVRAGWSRRAICVGAAPASALCFGLMAAIPDWLVTGAAMVAFGFTVTLSNVVTVSLRQELVPAEIFGRVLSLSRVLSWGALPVGAVMAGAVASAFGLRWALAACAVGTVLPWLANLRSLLAIGPHDYVPSARSALTREDTHDLGG